MKLTIDTKWLEAISDLDDSLRLMLLEAIIDYLSDKDPRLSTTEARTIFLTLKPFIDEERNKRIRLAERSRANGKKGGRKAEKKNLEEPKKPTGFCGFLELPEYQGRCENLLKLDEWKQKNTPFVYKNLRPLTQKEFEQLTKKYSSRQICDTLLQIENRKDLRKKYSDPYLTLLNWMKREYGNA